MRREVSNDSPELEAANTGDLVRQEHGLEDAAPVNDRYSSSFDEFAGVFSRDEPVMLADRSRTDFGDYPDAVAFGYRMAHHSTFAGRDWAGCERDLAAKWRDSGHNDWDEVWPAAQMGFMMDRGADGVPAPQAADNTRVRMP